MPVFMTLATDLESVSSAITTAFTTADLITLLTAGISAVAGYVVLWFGVRKIASMLRSGIFRGKFRV